MKLPISIIIPTFNEEKYLPNLLKSIKNQTIQPKEIIVVDAYSLDSTRFIAKDFGCTVVNGGLPAKARNNGAKHATQPLLLFLDADVTLPSKFLEKTVLELQDRKLDIASCFIRPMSPLKRDHIMQNFVNYYMRFTRKFHPHIPGCCIFVNKSLHNKIKGFNESVSSAEDHDYVKRSKNHGKFGYLRAYKLPISVRRLTKEGRVKIALKYIAIELHLIFLGEVKQNIFRNKSFTDKPLN